jgi:molybdenum cofactor guanylyltransferase
MSITARRDVSALILAGGQSRRMGQDKALILWQGVPLIQRVYQVASQCCTSVYLVTPWPERYQAQLGGPAALINDECPGQGPLMGLSQGLRQVSTPWVLALACDLPNLDPVVIQGWMAQLAGLAPDCLAYVPQQATGEWEPLCGFYRREAYGALARYLHAGGRSCIGWLAGLTVKEIAIAPQDREMFHNCNRPEDIEGHESFAH